MRFIKPTLSFLLLLFCANSFAQYQVVYFFKENGQPVPSRDSADYLRIVRDPDSGSTLYNVFEFYTNNKKKFIGKSTTIKPVTLSGQGVSYYPNGKKKLVGDYKNGLLTGTAYEYYPNGMPYNVKEYKKNTRPKNKDVGKTPDNPYLIIACSDSAGKALVTDSNGYFIGYGSDFKYIEEEGTVKNGNHESDWKGYNKEVNAHYTESYADGQLLSGTSTDSAGVKHTYKIRRIEPEFKGGINGFLNYLARNIHYPAHAKENNIQGKVFISFLVKKDGKVKNIRLLRSVSPDIDQEALRVISQSPDWVPGQLLGIPVSILYTVPIDFSLSDGR